MDGGIAFEQQAAAMRSSIAWALLGLVIERPSYGYELVQRFKRTYGETLVLSSARRIYTALDSLRGRSLIEEVNDPKPHDAPTRRPKPHYKATPEGVRAYQDWLFIQIEEERQRHRLFARQLAMLEPEAALEVIDEYERECLDESVEPSAPETARETVAARLAEEDEHIALETRLSWLEYARQELKSVIAEREHEDTEAQES